MQPCTHDAPPRHFLPHVVMSALKFAFPLEVHRAASASFVQAVSASATDARSGTMIMVRKWYILEHNCMLVG